MKAFLIVLFALSISFCSDDNDESNGTNNFTGITYTNEIGEMVGNIDSTDWKLFVVHRPGISVPPNAPNISQPHPAYPNPTTSVVSCPIDIGENSILTMVVKNNQGKILQNLYNHQQFGVGFYDVQVDLVSYENGVYRIEYELVVGSKVYKSFGDVEVRKMEK
ncbi:MAG: hypothetical protein HUU10_14530 [Bacteroidetes bacterium]|nr:hypothetical protein [Bacteroidota bacterium]